MLNSDDERFEAYLKNFRPVVPAPLPKAKHRYGTLRSIALIATAAAILIVGILVSRSRAPQRIPKTASVERRLPLEPLTMGSANSWLAAAPSFDAALDDLPFRAKTSIPAGKQSAMAVLSEENSKL